MATQLSASPNKRYLFLGDSYIVRLRDYGCLPEGSFVIAKGGTAPRDWYDMVGNEKYVDYYAELNAVKESRLKGIVYYYGINDATDWWNVAYAERQLSDLRRLFPNTKIYVLKIFSVAVTYKKDWHVVSPAVEEYNAAISAFCDGDDKLVYLDTTEAYTTIYGNLRRGCTEDGIHLTEEYYGKWWKKIKKRISE